MPFTQTCEEHPAWQGETIEDAMAHVRADHTGTRRPVTEFITSSFVTQVEAQGNVPLRVWACRRCGARQEARVPRGVAVSPYCPDCEDPAE